MLESDEQINGVSKRCQWILRCMRCLLSTCFEICVSSGSERCHCMVKDFWTVGYARKCFDLAQMFAFTPMD